MHPSISYHTLSLSVMLALQDFEWQHCVHNVLALHTAHTSKYHLTPTRSLLGQYGMKCVGVDSSEEGKIEQPDCAACSVEALRIDECILARAEVSGCSSPGCVLRNKLLLIGFRKGHGTRSCVLAMCCTV